MKEWQKWLLVPITLPLAIILCPIAIWWANKKGEPWWYF